VLVAQSQTQQGSTDSKTMSAREAIGTVLGALLLAAASVAAVFEAAVWLSHH
jgi:hypothetical protein